jgi:hypothetical protein
MMVRQEAKRMYWMDELLEKHERPLTRGECRNEERPCPWVGCRYHLATDIHANGTLVLTFPGLELWEMRDTCALDVADLGWHTLELVGERFNLTRERVRQIERKALEKLGAHFIMLLAKQGKEIVPD